MNNPNPAPDLTSGLLSKFLGLFTLFLLLFTSTAFAQTEAQALEEVMIFEKENTNKKVEIRVNDFVTIPRKPGGQPAYRGQVKSLTPNGFELLNEKSGEIRDINLNELESIHLGIRSGRTILGAILLAFGLLLGVVGGVAVLIILALAAATASQIGGLFVIPILALFMIVGGAFLIANSNPKVRLRNWKWRLVRIKRVFIKRKK